MSLTASDRPRFWRALGDTAKVYNHALDDDRREHYWRALQDLDIQQVEAACEAAEKRAGTGNCRFFPLPGTIRALTSESTSIQRASVTAMTQAALKQGDVYCLGCDDTGWAPTIDGRVVSLLEAVKRNARHVRPCSCRASNHIYAAKKAREPKIGQSGGDRY